MPHSETSLPRNHLSTKSKPVESVAQGSRGSLAVECVENTGEYHVRILLSWREKSLQTFITKIHGALIVRIEGMAGEDAGLFKWEWNCEVGLKIEVLDDVIVARDRATTLANPTIFEQTTAFVGDDLADWCLLIGLLETIRHSHPRKLVSAR
jgi:hypothetical protein